MPPVVLEQHVKTLVPLPHIGKVRSRFGSFGPKELQRLSITEFPEKNCAAKGLSSPFPHDRSGPQHPRSLKNYIGHMAPPSKRRTRAPDGVHARQGCSKSHLALCERQHLLTTDEFRWYLSAGVDSALAHGTDPTQTATAYLHAVTIDTHLL